MGRILKINGGKTAKKLKNIISSVPDSDIVAEIAIGLNEKSLQNGDFKEEKKKLGNVHLAIGDNIFYGGSNKCSIHIDMIIYKASIKFDNNIFLDKGKLII